MSDEARVLELAPGMNRALALLADDAGRGVAAVQGELTTSHPRLVVEVLSLKAVPAGAGVSYGHTFVTVAPTALALAAMGYGDGLPRKAGNRAHVTIDTGEGPRRAPIVGRVAMNALVVDTRMSGEQDAGARLTSVVVFGDPARGEIPLAEWAQSVGETPVAVLAGVAAKVTVRVIA